jgi:hypothetical protein
MGLKFDYKMCQLFLHPRVSLTDSLFKLQNSAFNESKENRTNFNFFNGDIL